MKLKVFFADTIVLAACAAIDSIDENDGIRHMIVVPDRFSLLAEKMVLDRLGKDATFFTEVTGISGMCQKYLAKLEDRLLNSTDKILMIRDVLAGLKLSAFKNVKSPSFAREMLSTIEQLKSSGIYPSDLVYKGNSKSLLSKLEDIKKIYEKYEELRGDKLDPGALLSLFDESVFNIDEIKNTKFYFVGFDSLPNTGFEVLSKLSRYAAELSVAIPHGSNPNNAYIYENDLYNKIKKIAQRDGLEIEAEHFGKEKEVPAIAHLKNNLFGKVITCGQDSDYVRLFEAGNREDEVMFAAKSIKFGIVKGARFKDYNIAVSEVNSYKGVVEKVFSSFGIPYHIDIERKLSDTIVARFVLAIVKMWEEKFATEEVFKVLDFPFVGFSDERINELKTEARERGLHRIVPDEFKETKSLLETLNQYKELILESATEIGKKISLQEEAVIVQAFEKTENILARLSKIEVPMDELREILTFCFETEKVVAKPESSDCVYIGDATNSFFEERNHLFVLGASAEELPAVMTDSGLFSDRDIAKLKDNFDLEPTIRMMNRRARFKLFNNVLFGEKHLAISYVAVREGKRVMESQIFKDAELMFGTKRLKSSQLVKIEIDEKNPTDRFLFNLGCKSTAEEEIYRNSDNPYVKELQAALYHSLDCKEYACEEEITAVLKDFAFKNGRTRVTQLESFFKCPYSHFLSYALGLKEVKEAKLDAGKFGNFMHAIAEGVALGRSVEEVIEKNIKTDSNFKYLPEGSLDLIRRDGLRLEKDIKYEMSVSRFKPVLIEEKFEGTVGAYKMAGRVDRVDSNGEYYRIIDYKTGKAQSVLKELYYGEKLQLLIYDSLVKSKLNQKSAGVFYFNANYRYDKKRASVLDGEYLREENVIKSLDPRLGQDMLESDVVNLKLTTKLMPYETCGFKDSKTLKNCVDYAKKMTETAAREIESGNIKKNPLKGECERCKYLGICSFKGNARPKDKEVKEGSFDDKT